MIHASAAAIARWYRRDGNLFVFMDVAICMRDLTDVHYPGAERIRTIRADGSLSGAPAVHAAARA
jgi:hypothetical protein